MKKDELELALKKILKNHEEMENSEISENLIKLATKIDPDLFSNNKALKYLLKNVPVVTNANLFDRYERALIKYGDPNFYFGILIHPDRPAGEFADDYDEDFSEYDIFQRPVHGSLARKTLRRYFQVDDEKYKASDSNDIMSIEEVETLIEYQNIINQILNYAPSNITEIDVVKKILILKRGYKTKLDCVLDILKISMENKEFPWEN